MRVINRDNPLYEVFNNVLGESYLSWDISYYRIEEKGVDPDTVFEVELIERSSEQKKVQLKAEGKGVLDAFFSSMLELYSVEYQSLKTINFADFKVTTNIDSKESFAGSDSEVQVELTIENSYHKHFTFIEKGRSMLNASVLVTLSAIEFFVNSEKTYLVSYKAMEESKKRNRQDLVDQYRNILIQLVENTSYSETIENSKKDNLSDANV